MIPCCRSGTILRDPQVYWNFSLPSGQGSLYKNVTPKVTFLLIIEDSSRDLWLLVSYFPLPISPDFPPILPLYPCAGSFLRCPDCAGSSWPHLMLYLCWILFLEGPFPPQFARMSPGPHSGLRWEAVPGPGRMGASPPLVPIALPALSTVSQQIVELSIFPHFTWSSLRTFYYV